MSGHVPICNRCGSSKSRKTGEFLDSSLLSDAVAKANIPRELIDEISDKESKKNFHSHKNTKNEGNNSELIRAMKSATGETGALTLESLRIQLATLDSNRSTAEMLIGQAEAEGILIRSGDDEWSWLQQSS